VIDIGGTSIDAGTALLVVSAVAVGGFLRGFVGFGGALAMVPALALALGPRMGVAVASLVGLPAVFQLLPEALRHADRDRVGPIGLAILLGAPLGSLILTSIPAGVMTGAIGVIVMLMALMTWRQPSRGLAARPWIGIAAGGLSGLLQGAAGIGGPPSVVVLMAQGGEPRKLRANVLAVAGAIGICGAISHLWFGIFTWPAVTVALVLLPIFVGSTWIGSRFFNRGGDRHFRAAAMGVLVLIGLAAVVGSLLPLLRGGG
jgi:uncharacterized membrane protein YfcA